MAPWASILAVTLALLMAGPGPLAAQDGQQAQEEVDETLAQLPEGEGREEVSIYCGACHSLRLVTQQRLPRYRWEELLVWMNEKQGMERLDADEEQLVIDYLAEHFGTPKRRRKF